MRGKLAGAVAMARKRKRVTWAQHSRNFARASIVVLVMTVPNDNWTPYIIYLSRYHSVAVFNYELIDLKHTRVDQYHIV